MAIAVQRAGIQDRTKKADTTSITGEVPALPPVRNIGEPATAWARQHRHKGRTGRSLRQCCQRRDLRLRNRCGEARAIFTDQVLQSGHDAGGAEQDETSQDHREPPTDVDLAGSSKEAP
jgi:hypothetical protein